MIYKQEPESKSSRAYSGGAIGFSGPPGAGKSTIGKLVAKELKIPFFDMDDLIAKKAGYKTSGEVVNNDGLLKFKEIQHSCFKEVSQDKSQKFVLSFGGHINRPEYDPEQIAGNKILLKENLFNICLIPSDNLDEVADILWPRQNDGKRETGSDTEGQYRLYVQNSIPQYIEAADQVVFTHNASIDDVVTIIMSDVIRG